MAHSRDNGNCTVKYGLRHLPLVEGPQILYGSAAPSHNHHIDPQGLQRPYAGCDAGCSALPLNQSRIQNDLHIWIPPACNLDDVPNGGSRICSHHSQSPDESGYGALMLLSEQPGCLQLLLEPLEPFIEQPAPLQQNLSCIELVFPVPLVHIHRSAHDHLLPLGHTKRETLATARKHDAVYGPFGILQCKIDMS